MAGAISVRASADGYLLAVDTSTRSSIVVLGRDEPRAVDHRDVRHRHGSHVLEQIDEVLIKAGASLDDVSALVVGTGPGSFTGLRVGLATIKTLAYICGLPVVGVMSSDALRQAAAATGAGSDVAVVLPAGARDHYLARAGMDAVLIAPGDLRDAVGDLAVLTIDLESAPLGADAETLGRAALDGLPEALLSLGRARLAAGEGDDVGQLVPAYVALPRGVSLAPEELGWSPDLR
jgi:tRNA threonylcarbamoyl adenosine modification protein YeaZ